SESKSASRPGRQQLPLLAGKFFALWAYHFFTRYTKIRPWSLPAQQPLDTSHRPLDPLDKVVAGIQLKRSVDSLPLKEGMDRLCVLLNWFQDRIAGLGLPVPQREIDAVRRLLRLMGE